MKNNNPNEPKSLAYQLGECFGCLIILMMGFGMLSLLIFALIKTCKWLWVLLLALFA